jgi:CHAT domain-containing protein/tetratricopeptide (TPR) repeat protein
MSFTIRLSLCFLFFSLSLISPGLAQTQSVPNPSTSSEINDLAAALVAAASEEEQERLLARKPGLMNSSLLAELKALADPLIKKGDYARALIISHLAVRIAERIGDRTELGNALIYLGAIYRRQYLYAQALERFQKSQVIYEEAGDKSGIARALYEIGLIHRTQSRLDQALEYYNMSLKIIERIGNEGLMAEILNEIGSVYRLRGRYEHALEFCQKSRTICEELNNKAPLRDVFNNIGHIRVAQGYYELALEFYQKSRMLSEELNDKVMLEALLNSIGNVYIYQGRLREALECLHKSLDINEEIGNAPDKRGLATRLHNIGRAYRLQGRDDTALEYYRKSLKIREEINDIEGIGGSRNNIGVIYKSQGLYEQALEWFQKSMKSFEEMGNVGGEATCLNNIGDNYRLQRRYDLAVDHLRKSLRLRENINDRQGVSRTLNNLILLYQDQGHYTGMLDVSRRAARLAEEINAPEELWSAQNGIGRALRALGRPTEARRSFLLAIGVIESLRHEVAGGVKQQQSFLENKLSPWLSMIELLVSQKEYAEALSFAERSKAKVLLDTLQVGRANLRGSLSPQERQTEEEHRFRLVSLNSQLTNELRRDKPDSLRVAELKASIEKARLEFEALETSLYVAHPELKVNRGEASIINAEEMAALLPGATSALLEYVVTDEATYLFVVTKAQGQAAAEIKVFTIPIKQTDLAKQIEVFRRQLAERNLGVRAPAHKLYDLLLKPAQSLLRGKSDLIIAPDDRLWELPFQALLDEGGRYLIERSAVSYAPSLTVLREMRARSDKRRAEAAPSTLLALGNPLIGQETVERARLTLRDGKLYPLPEAEAEVRALGRLYGARRSKVYIGAEAREDSFKFEAGQSRIIHFATHGVLNNAAPLYSYLALAQGDKNEDGLLEAWELMQLDLKADLAVLSACETARGRTSSGEGVIGLTWALFVAGAPATVVSQWEVESASTRDLMLGFHRQLQAPRAAGKLTKAEGLRRAALKLMKNPKTNHPFYWAGFVLVGDNR